MFSRIDDRFSSMTIALTVNSSGVGNGTVVQCTSFEGSDVDSSYHLFCK